MCVGACGVCGCERVFVCVSVCVGCVWSVTCVGVCVWFVWVGVCVRAVCL